MKFGENKSSDQDRDLKDKNLIREKIWENPSIIAQLFNDPDWEAFDEKDVNATVPSQEMFNHITENIRLEALAKEGKQHYRKQITIKLLSYSSWAAAIVTIILAFGPWQWTEQGLSNDISKVQQSQVPPVIPQTIWTTVENNSDHSKTVKLPDLSTVGLFAHSSIRYPKTFAKDAREIYLRGKAYFSVSKDASRPFSVYAGGTKTTALGTSFTINTHAASHQTSVRLHTGKIVVASTMSIPAFTKVILNDKGESLYFNRQSNKIEQVQAGLKKVSSRPKTLETNLLNMNNIPLPAVFRALQDAYSVKINIGNSAIHHIQYTGSVDVKNEPIHDALTLICLINELRYVVEQDGSYTIYDQHYSSENKK